jgi:hypothetical protein
MNISVDPIIVYTALGKPSKLWGRDVPVDESDRKAIAKW